MDAKQPANLVHSFHPDVFCLSRKEADRLFKETPITDNDFCDWISECYAPARRLAVYNDYSDGYTVKFLCERHKNMGLYGR